MAAHSQKGLPAFGIYGRDVQDIGDTINPDFLQEYLGMRTEYVDCSEILRRVQQEIYDKEEYEKTLEWTKKHCKINELPDHNPETIRKTREQKDQDWEFVVKMTLIIRDLMQGNEKLDKMGFAEGAFIAGIFQGRRIFVQVVD
jgi:L-fucose isomerase